MTTTPVTTEAPIAAWADRALRRAAERGEPAWAIAQRRRAASVAEALPLPHRGLELWRRTDFGGLPLTALEPFPAEARAAAGPGDLPPRIRERLAETIEGAALLVQRNGTVVLERTPPELARQGVIVCSMERALRDHPGRLESRLNSLIETDHDKFAALNQLLRSGGAFVWVPDGVTLDQPIRLFQWLDGAGAIAAPGSVIVLGARSQATVIEELLSETTEGASFHDGATEVFVGADARLSYATLQDWGRNVYHYSNQRAEVQRGGELQWMQTLLGSRMEKTNSYFRMVGPGAQVFVHGFMFGEARQHFDLHTLQQHLADHTTSDLLIKSCLKDRARSIYQGLIQVAEGAQRTDAYQANRNLLLSDTARADSIPGLEILANDVRCTHGATIGNVDPEQLHYLMTRGLPRLDAQRLIVEGFFAPVIDRIPLESVREQLQLAIQRKIG
jgi:Fe-S cluster assembly protein SufD